MPRSTVKRSLLVAATTLVLAAAIALPRPAAAEQNLVVGLLLPFTGQYAWVGSDVQPVAQMIAKQVNESGGIGGRKIKFAQGDTEGKVDSGTTAAQKLINVNNALALIGPTSLSFTGSKQLIINNGVPMISPSAGTTALDHACMTVCFRTVPSDALGGRAIALAASHAKYLASGADAWKRPALMVAKSPAMVSFKKPIEDSFSAYGDKLVKVIDYSPDKPSYRGEVQTVMNAHPDGIVLVGTPEDSARIMANAYQAGYEGGWFVTQDQTNADFIKLAGKQLVNGIYGLEEVASEKSAKRNRAFEKAYEKYSGEKVQIFGTNTYDAMNVLALAMLRAHLRDGQISRKTIAQNIRKVANPGPDKVAVTDYAAGKKALKAGEEIDYRGLVGPIDFDKYGNITAPFGIRQVNNGAWHTVATIPAEALK